MNLSSPVCSRGNRGWRWEGLVGLDARPGPRPRPRAPPAAPLSSLFFQHPGPGGRSQRGVRPWAPCLRGHGAGNVGCWTGPGRGGSSGLGGGPERKAPGPDWNKVSALGAQPGFIDLARCSSHQAGPAPGRLPVFPGVGTPWGNGFSCGCGVGMPPSTWGRPGRWGHAGSCGGGLVWRLEIPQPANVRLLETGSQT